MSYYIHGIDGIVHDNYTIPTKVSALYLIMSMYKCTNGNYRF